MKTLVLLPIAMLIGGCTNLVIPQAIRNLPLPTVHQICSLPSELRGPWLEKVGSSDADMKLACLLMDK